MAERGYYTLGGDRVPHSSKMNLLRPGGLGGLNTVENGDTEDGLLSGLSRSRSYHGDRNRPQASLARPLHPRPGVFNPETRRNSLPKSLKLVLMTDSCTTRLPVLKEPPSTTGLREDEKRLNEQLKELLKGMLQLRQTNIALLKQLWNLADAMNEHANGLMDIDSSSDYTKSTTSLYNSQETIRSFPSEPRSSIQSNHHLMPVVDQNGHYGSHDSFEFDESTATSIPIVHLNPS